ncbi:MAG TPA: sensor domain-containing diguanylate cyclase, partial [Pyrinomonadaceae bacterium]|nr:sensor domain-containing diguanylate cyclase [Pyrinomonadaceae bacterium]
MTALHNVLLQKYAERLTPVHCAEQTIVQLHRYFEDVVLENNLAALVVEGLPLVPQRPVRELSRIRDLGRVARHSFFFVSPHDALVKIPPPRSGGEDRECVLIKRALPKSLEERFLVVADARFSAVLASVKPPAQAEAEAEAVGDSVIWTLEHDIVRFALDFLMARTRTESPEQAAPFVDTVRATVPKGASSQWNRAANYLSAAKTKLTVSVATELARQLQEQAGREVAINRIANAIRGSLDVNNVLQMTVNEVGRALSAQCCALRVIGDGTSPDLNKYYYRKGAERDIDQAEVTADLDTCQAHLANYKESRVLDGHEKIGLPRRETIALAVVPLIFNERCIGVLLVRTDDPQRDWQDNERLLLSTVAGQVAIAVTHARLFAQTKQQALTDALTNCHNRRSFEMQLEHDLQISIRNRQPVSLLMLDVDHFKRVNDTYGHDAGDGALRALADLLRRELRGMDTAARYGGEEFAIILPQVGMEDAEQIAERVRASIERTSIPQVGRITVSLGIATFPLHATSRDGLVSTADRALYKAKNSGRNRVCIPPPPQPS